MARQFSHFTSNESCCSVIWQLQMWFTSIGLAVNSNFHIVVINLIFCFKGGAWLHNIFIFLFLQMIFFSKTRKLTSKAAKFHTAWYIFFSRIITMSRRLTQAEMSSCKMLYWSNMVMLKELGIRLSSQLHYTRHSTNKNPDNTIQNHSRRLIGWDDS